MVTHGSVSLAVPIVVGINVLNYLDSPRLQAKFEHSDWRVEGIGLKAVLLNVIWAYEAYQRVARKQRG